MTTAETVRVFAPAKINLFLHVGVKRADGYHDLQSLVAFADVGDELSFAPADDLTLSIDGPFAAALSADADNLVLKAARALAQAASVRPGARISLTKNLPVASGIGGGSADAAATLRGLSRLWKQNIADTELLSIAAALGSDVPVCLKSRAAWMEGRGEHVTPLVALPEIPIVLVNPGVGVPTAAVFKALATRRGTGLEYPKAFSGPEELFRFLESTTNDLEAPAMAIAPVISDVIATLKSLPGTRLVRMSGSGATCFALFESADRANGAVQVLAAKHPNWWVRATKTLSHDGSALQ